MAGLINARAIVTTTGHLTEPVWADTAPSPSPRRTTPNRSSPLARALLSRDDERDALAARGEKTYRELLCAGPHGPRASRRGQGAAA